MSHNRSLQRKRGRMAPASGCCGTGAVSPSVCWQITLTIVLYAGRYSNSQHNKVPVLQNAESLQASETCGMPLWDTHHGACMQERLGNCSQTYTVHLCQGTGVTMLTGYPNTSHFPASQRRPPATILSHPFLPSCPNFLSKSSPPPQPITHILHHTKLALTCLKPSFSHLDLRKTACIHCLLLTTEPL